jgi:hypothetical protein
MNKITSRKRIPIIPLIIILLCFNACTTIHFKAITPPPPSPKLHVAVLTITGDGGKSGWAVPHDKWSNLMLKMASEHLRDTGIYEVVPQKDVNYAVGKQTLSADEYWWLKNDCALLKQYGKALYADYAMIITRYAVISASKFTSSYKYDMKFINIETGMRYSSSDYLVNTASRELNIEIATKKIFPSIYRKLFHEAKGDLLATAIRKGRLIPTQEIKKPAAPETNLALAPPSAAKPAPAPPIVVTENKPSPAVKTMPKPVPPASKPPAKEEKLPLSTEPLSPKTTADVSSPKKDTALPSDKMIKKTIPDAKEESVPPKMIAKISPPTPPADLSIGTKRNEFEKILENELQNKTSIIDKTRLVVYDFNANEQLQVVSLILTDALREELFILGLFSLVNRENLAQVMQELSLQQSGLVDEKQVVKLGKWLAANEAVTGRFTQFSNSYILQAKRTDITTMSTLGLGSLKCTVGKEEELLAGLPELARKIAGLKK